MKLFAFVLAVIVTFTSFGSNDADSVKVYFRAGQRQFDPSLGENREKMDRCMALVKAYAESDIDSIVIKAYTSPDGTSTTNELLARQRCDAVSDYIVANSGINRGIIRKMPEGIAWEELRTLVYATPEVPSREAVLNILDNTPVWVFDSNGKVVDGRKSQLMSLNRGAPYNWMLENLFPQLRNAVAIVVVPKSGAIVEEESELSEGTNLSELIELTEESELSDYSDNSNISDNNSDNSDSLDNSDNSDISISEDRFALKTNLLYYAALMPNVELEWRFNKRWSVAIDGDIAWYGGGVRKYRLAYVTPEVRYRFLSREAWRGMYVGIFIGPGLYDLENGGTGYEGEGVMTGVSLGYAWPIAKRLSLEAGIGVGYLYTRYKEYEPMDGHYLYQRTKDLNYFGPLRLRLSLVWRFGHKREIRTNKNTMSVK